MIFSSYNIKQLQPKQGFTLVETLVAITILLIGVLGPLAIAARGIGDGMYAQNQITANYLAQEALEYFTWQKGKDIDTNQSFFSDYVSSTNPCPTGVSRYCFLQPSDGGSALFEVETSDCSALECSLVYDQASGLFKKYDEVNAEDRQGTSFQRRIKIDQINVSGMSVKPVKVTVTLNWSNRLMPREMTVYTHLYPNFVTTP